MPHIRETYAGVSELPLLKKKGGKGSTTTVLLGAWLSVRDEPGDGWLKVRAFGKEGWVRESDTRDDCATKIFFVDVGQGDAVLIETPTERIIVDGGPGTNFSRYIRSWKYKWLLKGGGPLHFDAVVVSHFDADHFAGLIPLIEDPRITFDTIYHNGIARFRRERANRPAEFDTDLGASRENADGNRAVLTTSFSTLKQALVLRDRGGLMATFRKFIEAAEAAHSDGRLRALKRLTADTPGLTGITSVDIDVLGPVPRASNRNHFDWFGDSSHTRNGHSVVLKITSGDRTFLLGGDLNIEAEHHLLAHHGPAPFRVDVAKACHHGASEFTTEFLAAIESQMTIISSGDNENYGHPQPDAVGAIGRHSRGDRPLIFSTELARSISPRRIHYGLINVRTNGNFVVGAQMFEKQRSGDMWNSFVI